MREALIIFTRAPIPEKTKTRMMPYLNGYECASLHKCLLRDLQHTLQKTKKDTYVFYTPTGKQELLFPVFGDHVRYMLQAGDTIGEKMQHAFQTVFQEGYQSCILIGSDIPTLSKHHIVTGFQQLKNHDIVIGPTMDGGYYLIGMKKLWYDIFETQTYGHSLVFQQTVQTLINHNSSIGYTEMLNDMDTPEDLKQFLRCNRKTKLNSSNHTMKFLLHRRIISIIIPIYNEDQHIEEMMRQLYSIRNKCEIIFVDGGSTDDTIKKIGNSFTVIHSKKGRANQMNTGASVSKGDLLFFLHCDSKIPYEALEQIHTVMENHRVGGFGITFASRNFLMYICKIISNFRMKVRGIIFGDQGIFIERDYFFDLGMFPPIPIMEDYQLSLTLQERGEPIGVTKNRICTSSRRYPKGTVPKLRLMWKMNRLRKMYRTGISPDRITKYYQDIR